MGVFGMGIFFYAQQCENILMIDKRFEVTFLEKKIIEKIFSPSMRFEHFHGREYLLL